MFRPSRRFTAALLWIAIALLPVRGFAAVMMPTMVAGMAPTAASEPVHDTASAMPCHGATQQAADAPADGHHTCSLCDLCHSGVVPAKPPATTLAAANQAQPQSASTPAPEPRAPEGLFRPPRTLLN